MSIEVANQTPKRKPRSLRIDDDLVGFSPAEIREFRLELRTFRSRNRPTGEDRVRAIRAVLARRTR